MRSKESGCPRGTFAYYLGIASSLALLVPASAQDDTLPCSCEAISVKCPPFNAVGNGIADDTTAIQSAINSLPATGGEICFPRGTYRITSPILVGNGSAAAPSTLQNIVLTGHGTGSTATVVFPDLETTKILYDGPSGGAAVLWLRGPLVCGVRNLSLDCNNKADRGLYAVHVFNSRFQWVNVKQYLVYGIELTAFQRPASCWIGANDNLWDSITVGLPSSPTATCMHVGQSSAEPGDLDVARNSFRNCAFLAGGASTNTAVALRFCDIITFFNCFLLSQSGVALRVVTPTGNTIFPSECAFYNSPTVGSVYIDPAWRPVKNRGLAFWPFNVADVETSPNPIPQDVGFGGITGVTTEGDFFNRYQLTTVYNQQKYSAPAVLYRTLSRVAVVNTTAWTALASYTVPANALGADRVLRARISGSYVNNSGVQRSLSLQVKVGSLVIVDLPAVVLDPSAAYRSLLLEFTIAPRTDIGGSWKTVTASGTIGAPFSAGGQAQLSPIPFTYENDSASFDSLVAMPISVLAQHNVALTAVSVALSSLVIEML